ncbi:uncharacterized protein LOC111347576 [Stylophora pistillata]|nr:uncharacterized protein LOC111347576 [Stylophora pistillata]
MAEAKIFKNNFPQVLMVHAASAIASNYELVVQEFDGCSIPVLKGCPVSGKTTAMKAALSVLGKKNDCISEATSKFIETKQGISTIPFGWDDCSCVKTLKNMAVNSYNACGSANVRKTYIPRTVPLVTTNLDLGDLKYKSRWLRIIFEDPNPKLAGMDRHSAERGLREAMKTAHKSVRVVTINTSNYIYNRMQDEDFASIVAKLEDDFPDLDQRASASYSLLLYVT